MSHRYFLAVILVGLVFVPCAQAGMANADLACEMRDPAAPAFTLKGNIPGDQVDFSLTLEAAGRQTTYEADAAGDGDGIAVVDDLHYGVFTLSIWRGKDVEVTLYALPRSVREGVAPDGRKRFKFNALLRSAPSPGAERGQTGYRDRVHDLVLRCTHDYGV